MKGIIGFILFLVVLGVFVSQRDCSRKDSWRDSHKDVAVRVGLNASDLMAPVGGTPNTYKFDLEDHNNTYPPLGVLYYDRNGVLELSWDFNEHAFWNSEPAIHVESPSSDTATIEEKSGQPQPQLQMGYASHPRLAIRIKSGNPAPHVTQVRLENMHVAIAEMRGSGFEYRSTSINPTSLRILLSSAPASPSVGSEPQNSLGDTTTITPESYIDPKGFFMIAPPQGWRVQKYPQDPRGKVAFVASGDQIDLRVLAKAVNMHDYDGLIKNLKDIEKQSGVPMNIEPVVFNGMPAIKRMATVTTQGVMQKILWIDLLIDGVSHNLQYGAPPNVFDKYYNTAWQSMMTYKPLKLGKPSSPEDARKHETAKWIRLAKIALEMDKTQAAKDAVSAGLKTDPKNPELKQLKSELGIQ